MINHCYYHRWCKRWPIFTHQVDDASGNVSEAGSDDLGGLIAGTISVTGTLSALNVDVFISGLEY